MRDQWRCERISTYVRCLREVRADFECVSVCVALCALKMIRFQSFHSGCKTARW